MKPFLPFLAAAIGSAFSVFAQEDCTGGRYSTALFPNVTVTSDVLYGSAIGIEGTPVNLLVDVYTPDGDTETNRPALILAHGGSFYQGSKTLDNAVVELCNRFAQMGYVTFSMNYRLESIVNIALSSDIEKTFLEAVFRAVQDQRTLIRFLEKSVAEGGNPYGINPNLILVGGNSAGAILSLHNAYLEDDAEIPTKIDTSSLGGGFVGDHQGYFARPKAVVNLCGALGDTSWMVSGNMPFVSVHGNNDAVVPHNSAIANPGIPVMLVHGSESMNFRAMNVGVDNGFRLLPGAGHSPFNSSAAYMDTTFTYVRDWLANKLCTENLSITPTEASNATPLLYPNPAAGSVQVKHPLNIVPTQVRVFDYQGRMVAAPGMELSIQHLPAGVYIVELQFVQETRRERLIVQ
jgi:para-nitrobenzyl esterase